MKVKSTMIEVLIAILTLFLLNPTVQALNAVASIKQANGQIKVERGKDPKRMLIGHAGLILNDRDIVVTVKRSKATILFRDGSEVRLFQKTRFEIFQSKEDSTSGSRRFINKILLKFGSFWGKFARGNQQTIVETPTAIAGIKGTIISLSENNGRFSASLSSGAVAISNDEESVDLKAGQMVKEVSRTGSIENKISNLPYQIRISPDQQKISLPNLGEKTSIYFILQLVNVKSNENVNRSGDIHISAESDKIEFPETIQLNARGYTRVKATVHPFQRRDYKNGQIEIIAFLDGEEFIDVGTGQTMITYDIPEKSQKMIRIDGSSGTINP